MRSLGLPTTPLPSTDALAVVLLADKAIDVQLQWLKAVEVEVDAPERAVPLLDDVLIRETGALQAPARRVG